MLFQTCPKHFFDVTNAPDTTYEQSTSGSEFIKQLNTFRKETQMLMLMFTLDTNQNSRPFLKTHQDDFGVPVRVSFFHSTGNSDTNMHAD